MDISREYTPSVLLLLILSMQLSVASHGSLKRMPCSKIAEYVKAYNHLKLARKYEKSDISLSIKHLRRGNDILQQYSGDEHEIDDTGTKIVFSRSVKNISAEARYHMERSALESRLEMYKRNCIKN